MPTIRVEGYGTFEVPAGTRLVRALKDHGVDIAHRCGGYARCTTCRVEFLEGEPDDMTLAEYTKLDLNELLGTARLACQIAVTQDATLRPVITLSNSDLPDAGPEPKEEITPPPQWISVQADR